jgi:hypothetical protein
MWHPNERAYPFLQSVLLDHPIDSSSITVFAEAPDPLDADAIPSRGQWGRSTLSSLITIEAYPWVYLPDNDLEIDRANYIYAEELRQAVIDVNAPSSATSAEVCE